jgi:TatD DNase family protein
LLTNLVDFHCHLDLFSDHAAAFIESERAGVHTLTVTTTPKAWPRNSEMASKAHFVRAALGIHPQLVAERANELYLWETYLPQTHYVGEVGLDAGPKFYRSLELQKIVFEKILIQCNRSGGKILTIHSVRTATTVLDMIEKHLHPDRNRIILHWFTGSKKEARRAADLGCYFSINAEMLKAERHQNMILSLPLDRILTETDGPFCMFKGNPMRPIDISYTVDILAKSIGLDPELLTKKILSNLDHMEALFE